MCGALRFDAPLTAEVQRDGWTYSLTQVRASSGGFHVVAVVCLTAMGNPSAASAATRMVHDCPHLRYLIVCGIAGGAPNPGDPQSHVRLGDVVVSGSAGVLNYHAGKETQLGVQRRVAPLPPAVTLLRAGERVERAALNDRRSWEETIQRFISSHGRAWSRPGASTDRLYASSSRTKRERHPVDKQRQRGAPRVFYGTIMSADVVQKNPRLRDELRDAYGARAFEMEGAGIAHAAWEHEIGYLIVRGISDYCDSWKNDRWQRYAAVAAAAYCRAVIEETPVLQMGIEKVVIGTSVQTVPREAERGLENAIPGPAAVAGVSLPQAVPPVAAVTFGEGALVRVRDLQRSIEDDLSKLELPRAFRSAKELEECLREQEAVLPPSTVGELFLLLARVEVAKLNDTDEEQAVSRARLFLERAKNVSSR
ncbi:MAG: hypothetical protein ACHQ50_16050 [Fimbriimonadales bacterium]